MSAIFGLWRLDGGPVDAESLGGMSERLAHRGPDGSGAWRHDWASVGLGHRMFHTTPESRLETQPLVAREGELALVADARLDNREALIRGLDLRDRPAGEVTDAELVLEAYGAWGSRCPERLLGAFAFAIWDGRRRELLCVRDHFGVKPLYYHHAPGRLFAFASEIKALLALEEVPEEIDELEVARHLLVPVEEDPEATYYRRVRRVSPGHAIRVSAAGLEPRRYWALDPSRELRLSSDEEYAEAVRERFIEAVRCRLRATTPVGSMLSGGLDSSSVTCVAARERNGAPRARLHTFSAVYEEVPESDERDYIRAVVDRYDVAPHFFVADGVSPVDHIDCLNWHGDGANKAGNLYLNWHLGTMAAGAGVRVLLDGFDGDATLSHGTGYFRELARRGRWLRLARVLRPFAERQGQPWRAAYWSWIRAYGIGGVLRRAGLARIVRRERSGANGTPAGWAQGLAPDFASRLPVEEDSGSEGFQTEWEHHHRLLTRPILLQTLSWIEAVGAGAGVEVRFPFFDVRLAELCLSLPAEQKLRRGWSRFVMRRAMEGILPDRVQWRPDKSNLGPGFRNGLMSLDRQALEAIAANDGAGLAEYVKIDYVYLLHGRLVSGQATTSEELALWRALSLALWLNAREAAPS